MRSQRKPNGTSSAATSHLIDLQFGDVDDPAPGGVRRRRRVAINTRTDTLEQEYAHGRLSEAAYRSGRIYQRVLERSGNSSSFSSSWPSLGRIDNSADPDAHIVRRLDNAAEAVAMLQETRPIVGIHGERILTLVLGQGLSLGEAAARLMTGGGSISRHATSFYAWLFRQVLEALADFWSKCSGAGRWRRLAGGE